MNTKYCFYYYVSYYRRILAFISLFIHVYLNKHCGMMPLNVDHKF